MADRWLHRVRGRGAAARALLRVADRLEARSRAAIPTAPPGRVVTGPRATVGPDVRFVLDDLGRGGDIVLGGDCWIGRGVRILPGVTIGPGAVVRSYSVVHDDVRPFAVVRGNPAEEVERRFDDATVEALLRVAWWEWDDATVAAHRADLDSADVTAFLAKYAP